MTNPTTDERCPTCGHDKSDPDWGMYEDQSRVFVICPDLFHPMNEEPKK